MPKDNFNSITSELVATNASDDDSNSSYETDFVQLNDKKNKQILLDDLKKANQEIENCLENKNKSGNDNTSQMSNIVTTISTLKNDMTKLLKIVDQQNQQTNFNQNEILNLKKELHHINHNKIYKKDDESYDNTSYSSVSYDTSSTVSKSQEDQSYDSYSYTESYIVKPAPPIQQNVSSTPKIEENITVVSKSSQKKENEKEKEAELKKIRHHKTDVSVSSTSDTESGMSSMCSYEEFNRFKLDVTNMINELSNKVNSQTQMLSNIVCSISQTKKVLPKY